MLGLFETSSQTIKHDDRRMFVRRPAYGQVDAIVTKNHEPIHVELRDISVAGASGLTVRPVNRGESITMCFPPEGRERGFNSRGKIVRCEPSATGYRIAVQFDQPLGV